MTLDELHTLLLEIESTVNNRPLTYLSSDEFDQALTPAHLVYGRRLDSLPDTDAKIVASESDLIRTLLTKRQKYLACVLKDWWSLWNHEYLVSLRETHKLKAKNSGTLEVNKGDIVTMSDENSSRGSWRLGRVEELIRSKDGKIRGVSIKIVTPKGRSCVINRPVSNLYPLEVSDNTSNAEIVKQIKMDLPQYVEVKSRPRKAAAIDSDFIRKLKDSV